AGGGRPYRHSPAGRNQDRGATSLRAQPAVQAEPTVPGRHRGPDLGSDSRPGHAALSGQRARAVRGFGRSGGADQQPDADRRVVAGPETSPPGKARLSPAVLSPFLLTEAGSDPPVLADLRLSRRSPPGFRQRR